MANEFDSAAGELEAGPVKAPKLTTADRLAALEAGQEATHKLVREIHAAVGQVAQLAGQAGQLVENGGIGSLLGGLVGDVGGPKGAILSALFKRH